MRFLSTIMKLFLRVFACRSAICMRKQCLPLEPLHIRIGPDFVKYMPEFYKYLEMGLQNFEEYQVCAVTVGVVGDICRALEDKIVPRGTEGAVSVEGTVAGLLASILLSFVGYLMSEINGPEAVICVVAS
ncbi:Importin subunit beta-1 [Camellia lanceoleosa]|uniref:Importin subunit beta-1 n=1 Tax=Camellia lanceoleosa TaxID=1840588 RepID=A0ACC0IP74_9ERIC|nr:Importin subunit beta-1 [Camellia lanceoleosa]